MLSQRKHILVHKIGVECLHREMEGQIHKYQLRQNSVVKAERAVRLLHSRASATAQIDRGGLESLPGYTCMRCADNYQDFTSVPLLKNYALKRVNLSKH